LQAAQVGAVVDHRTLFAGHYAAANRIMHVGMIHEHGAIAEARRELLGTAIQHTQRGRGQPVKCDRMYMVDDQRHSGTAAAMRQEFPLRAMSMDDLKLLGREEPAQVAIRQGIAQRVDWANQIRQIVRTDARACNSSLNGPGCCSTTCARNGRDRARRISAAKPVALRS